MFGKKIKVSSQLYQRLKAASDTMGCSSLEEFVEKILENEASRILAKAGKLGPTAEEIREAAQKLKGLGYLE